MAIAEAQHLVNLSLKKILISRNKRGGIDLHRNLLLATVLLRARNACVSRTQDPIGYLDDEVMETTQDDATVTVTTTEDFESDSTPGALEETDLMADSVPNCDPPTIDNADSGQSRWDLIPDQALEEWDFLGADIGSEQVEIDEKTTEKPEKTDEDFQGTFDFDTSLGNSNSKKRSLDSDFDLESSTADGFLPCKRQKVEPTINCDSLCLNFDDLLSSIEGDNSIANSDKFDISEDLDHLVFSLDSLDTDSIDDYLNPGISSFTDNNALALSSIQISSTKGFQVSSVPTTSSEEGIMS